MPICFADYASMPLLIDIAVYDFRQMAASKERRHATP